MKNWNRRGRQRSWPDLKCFYAFPGRTDEDCDSFQDSPCPAAISTTSFELSISVYAL